MSAWIKCSERLPLINEEGIDFPSSEEVLVFANNKIYIGTYDEGGVWDLAGSDNWRLEVSHWQPLPESPKPV